MSLKNKAKKIVEHLTGIHIYRTMPHGIDFIQDISSSLPMCSVNLVFDVGANLGQSSVIYLARFPGSHIYCFEPVSDTFYKLQDKFKGNDRIDCYQLALGSSSGKGKMVLQGSSDLSFLLGQSKMLPENNNMSTESIDIVTLDEFCHTKSIDQINYLKIDTEGGDLEVLKGAVNMLTEQNIDLVEVEAGMYPGDNRHAPFEALKEFLESYRYSLFGIYEQVKEWSWSNRKSEPYLKRTNPVFISQRMIEMNRKSVGDGS